MKKTIIVGVTSSIAAYKSVQLVSDLLKKGYDVEVIMSKNATEFIQPLTFSSLTKHKTYVNTFDRVIDYNVEHISLAKKCDCFIIAPASANIIAKVANGICDDMLTTTFLACDCPKIIAPAMNTQMYMNSITQENIKKCKTHGMHFIEPEDGLLACGDCGKGKLANIETMIDKIEETLVSNKILTGKKVIVTAGPTVEKIDPVRFISNHSSGKMGYSIAKAARNLGAEVTLISGPVSLKAPNGIKVVPITSAKQMYEEMKNRFQDADYIIKAAAVADYRPSTIYTQKVKKKDSEMNIELERTDDILAYIGNHKTTQKICGFAMETENVMENAKQKLLNKNCDMLVVNNLFQEGAGFQKDTNVVSILTPAYTKEYPILKKEELAYIILETLVNI